MAKTFAKERPMARHWKSRIAHQQDRNRQYRTEYPQQCPNCLGSNYSFGKAEKCEESLYEYRHCTDCDFEWRAVYRLAGYLRVGHEANDLEALAETGITTSPGEEATHA